MNNSTMQPTWSDSLRNNVEWCRHYGYTAIVRRGTVYLFKPGAPRHCLATDVDNGRWIACPPFDGKPPMSHLYEDMAGEIERRLLPPWRHASTELTWEQLRDFYQTAKDCYCYYGVERCDFCTGLRSDGYDPLEWFPTWQAARELLERCGYEFGPPERTYGTKGAKWARIDGLGSAAGMLTMYTVAQGDLPCQD